MDLASLSFLFLFLVGFTLLEANIAPETLGLEDEFTFGFRPSCQVLLVGSKKIHLQNDLALLHVMYWDVKPFPVTVKCDIQLYLEMTPCSYVFHDLKSQKGFNPEGSK